MKGIREEDQMAMSTQSFHMTKNFAALHRIHKQDILLIG
jgi:hypothetical protein